MKKFLILLTSLIILLLCLSCGQESDKLYVITDATCPPFEFINTNTNQIEGFDVDLFNEIAKRNDLKIEYVNTSWDSMLGGLSQGTYKIAISAITIKESRLEHIDYSIPYYTSGQVVLTLKSNSDYRTLEALIGKRVGCESGTIANELLNGINCKVSSYDDLMVGLYALFNNQLDAVMLDNTFAEYYVKHYDNLKITSDLLTQEDFGIAYCKGFDKELQNKINDTINQMKTDGSYDALLKKWDLK